MGDTFGAWAVTMPNGMKHVIVSKAYAVTQSVATRRYPGYLDIELVCSKSGMGGEVVIVEDNAERLG